MIRGPVVFWLQKKSYDRRFLFLYKRTKPVRTESYQKSLTEIAIL